MTKIVFLRKNKLTANGQQLVALEMLLSSYKKT